MRPPYAALDDGLLIAIRLTPRGGADRVDGIEMADNGTSHIKVRVRAVPEDGKANAAVIALLAKQLGVAKSAISLASGTTSRQKRLRVEGDAAALAARIDVLLSTSGT